MLQFANQGTAKHAQQWICLNPCSYSKYGLQWCRHKWTLRPFIYDTFVECSNRRALNSLGLVRFGNFWGQKIKKHLNFSFRIYSLVIYLECHGMKCHLYKVNYWYFCSFKSYCMELAEKNKQRVGPLYSNIAFGCIHSLRQSKMKTKFLTLKLNGFKYKAIHSTSLSWQRTC